MSDWPPTWLLYFWAVLILLTIGFGLGEVLTWLWGQG